MFTKITNYIDSLTPNAITNIAGTIGILMIAAIIAAIVYIDNFTNQMIEIDNQKEFLRKEEMRTIWIILVPLNKASVVMNDSNAPIIIKNNETISNPEYLILAKKIHGLVEASKLWELSNSEKIELEQLRTKLKTTAEKSSIIYCKLRIGCTSKDVEKYINTLGGSILTSQSVQMHTQQEK